MATAQVTPDNAGVTAEIVLSKNYTSVTAA